jgi:hypothetical protein
MSRQGQNIYSQSGTQNHKSRRDGILNALAKISVLFFFCSCSLPNHLNIQTAVSLLRTRVIESKRRNKTVGKLEYPHVKIFDTVFMS